MSRGPCGRPGQCYKSIRGLGSIGFRPSAKNASNPNSRWPIYIDLHYYSDLASSLGLERSAEVKSRLVEDFRLVYEVAQYNREQKIVIIVDGVDDFFRSPFSLDHELEALIQGTSIDKKVIGLGHLRRDQMSQREDKREISHIVGKPEWSIELQSINSHAEHFEGLVIVSKNPCVRTNITASSTSSFIHCVVWRSRGTSRIP